MYRQEKNAVPRHAEPLCPAISENATPAFFPPPSMNTYSMVSNPVLYPGPTPEWGGKIPDARRGNTSAHLVIHRMPPLTFAVTQVKNFIPDASRDMVSEKRPKSTKKKGKEKGDPRKAKIAR